MSFIHARILFRCIFKAIVTFPQKSSHDKMGFVIQLHSKTSEYKGVVISWLACLALMIVRLAERETVVWKKSESVTSRLTAAEREMTVKAESRPVQCEGATCSMY